MADDVPLPKLAERCWRVLDVVHVPVYFAPEPTAAYAELGLRPRAGYFVSRSAPMGAVSPEVTIATFALFDPGLVRHVMRDAWDGRTPEQVLDARHAGVHATLRRILGDTDPAAVAEAAELTRAVCEHLEPWGRPLYAAHAVLPWPDDPLVALWHAATLVREHRGDAHMAALMLAGVGPLEALICDAVLTGHREFNSTTRGWSPEQWAATEQDMRSRGLLDDDGGLSESGAARYEAVQARTRAAAEPAWAAVGAEHAARIYELVRPMAKAVVASGDLAAIR